ncbi:MAG: hypothetical protein HYY29_01250 [Chloroflexi bacterium]|nr:hypothetical protein [Chloroflexota bacterium]
MRLNLEMQAKFLIDTGARVSMIGHEDTIDANLDYSRLSQDKMTEIGGLAGSLLCHTEEAGVILLDEHGDIFSFNVDIAIPPPGGTEKLPSILGRDILNRCEVRLNFNFGVVELMGPSRAKISSASGGFF